jgi:hypothetical protein
MPGPMSNTALSDALQTKDIAAVAFALRHGPTVVPLTADDGDVWTYRDPSTGDVALLLFSDEAHKPKTVPADAALESPAWLHAFLTTHQHDIAMVLLDFAGPHPMRATPGDLLAALDA